MDWRIYYGDGSTFDSERGSWDEAPAWDVQALVTPDELTGREINTNDFYIWDPDGSKPWACGSWGLMDYLIRIGRMSESQRLTDLTPRELIDAGVKLGRSIDNARFREVFARAASDPDFPKKSARLPNERT